MPILPNPKHERFAQGLAKGLSASAAYVEAGYAKSDSNASRLSGNEKVKARLAEIIGAAAERAGITRERIQAELAMVAFDNADVKDSDKIRALELLGKDIGMFKERVEHTGKDGGAIKTEVDLIGKARRLAFALAKAASEQG